MFLFSERCRELWRKGRRMNSKLCCGCSTWLDGCCCFFLWLFDFFTICTAQEMTFYCLDLSIYLSLFLLSLLITTDILLLPHRSWDLVMPMHGSTDLTDEYQYHSNSGTVFFFSFVYVFACAPRNDSIPWWWWWWRPSHCYDHFYIFIFFLFFFSFHYFNDMRNSVPFSRHNARLVLFICVSLLLLCYWESSQLFSVFVTFEYMYDS